MILTNTYTCISTALTELSCMYWLPEFHTELARQEHPRGNTRTFLHSAGTWGRIYNRQNEVASQCQNGAVKPNGEQTWVTY